MKEIDTKLVKALKPLHHSTGDWDYDSANWTLDTDVYVSAPSSFRPTGIPSGTIRALVKTAVVPIADVKEGRIVNHQRMVNWEFGCWYFLRYQDADNYYLVIINQYGPTTIHVEVIRRKATVETTLGTKDMTDYGPNAWRKFRVTWWNDYVGLVVRVEFWDGSAWIWILDAYDSQNNWKDVGGRVGFRLENGSYAGYFTWIDDSEIYGLG